MDSFLQTFGAIMLGGAISLVGSYLAHRWQGGRELQRYERESRERLASGLRAERKAAAADLWGKATRCHYLIDQECQGLEQGSEELTNASRRLTESVQEYLQSLERNALWVDQHLETKLGRLLGAFREFSMHFHGLSLTDTVWIGGKPDWQALATAYDGTREALGKFGGRTESEEALEQAG